MIAIVAFFLIFSGSLFCQNIKIQLLDSFSVSVPISYTFEDALNDKLIFHDHGTGNILCYNSLYRSLEKYSILIDHAQNKSSLPIRKGFSLVSIDWASKENEILYNTNRGLFLFITTDYASLKIHSSIFNISTYVKSDTTFVIGSTGKKKFVRLKIYNQKVIGKEVFTYEHPIKPDSWWFYYPFYYFTYLNDTTIGLQYNFNPSIFLYHTKHKGFTGVVCSPLCVTYSDSIQPFFPTKRQNNFLANVFYNSLRRYQYMPLIRIEVGSKVLFFQNILLPNYVENIESVFEKDNPSNIHLSQFVLYDQYLNPIYISEPSDFTFTSSGNQIITARKWDKNTKAFTILRYKIMISN